MLFRLRCFGLGVIACLIAAAALSQTQNSPSPAPISAAPQPTPASQEPSKAAPTSTAPKGFVIADATPVRLRTGRTISSADAHVGDTLDFEVLEEVQVEGVLVIPKGGAAFATVTEAEPKRRILGIYCSSRKNGPFAC